MAPFAFCGILICNVLIYFVKDAMLLPKYPLELNEMGLLKQPLLVSEGCLFRDYGGGAVNGVGSKGSRGTIVNVGADIGRRA